MAVATPKQQAKEPIDLDVIIVCRKRTAMPSNTPQATVLIDEASQVSIAQAFPALLRAKKILILGDKKQFSNIKAAQARSETNREYLNNLEISFKANVSRDLTKLVKLQKFNIRTSILEFFEFITNYQRSTVPSCARNPRSRGSSTSCCSSRPRDPRGGCRASAGSRSPSPAPAPVGSGSGRSNGERG